MVNTDSLQKVVTTYIAEAEKILDRGLSNIYISTSIKVFLGLYAALAAPKLPKVLLELMNNVVVRVIWAAVIVVMATKDPSIAIITAVAFIVTLEAGNKMKLYDTSASLSDVGETSWLPSTKGGESPFFPDMGPLNPIADIASNAISNVTDVATNAISNVTEIADNTLDTISGDEHQQHQQHQQNPGVSIETNEEIQPFLPHQNGNNLADINMMRNSNITEGLTVGLPTGGGDIQEEGVPASFTSGQQFKNAQMNIVPGSNQGSCVQSWDNQHCAQGLQSSDPQGYTGESELSQY
jgi:hypothetical protein